MQLFKSIFKAALFSCLLCFSSAIYGACSLTFNGSLCAGNPITFSGDVAGTTHNFNFNGEGTFSGNRVVNFIFKTAGNKTVTYITTINGTKCTTTINLSIKSSPTRKLKLKSNFSQCFENNLFCFEDSSYNTNGAAITRIRVDLNDGQTFNYANPKMPLTQCYSFKDPRGGNIILYYEIEDANGCIYQDTINNAGKVYPKIGARFTRTSPKNPACDSVFIQATNLSQIAQTNVKNIVWYWGDGYTDKSWGPVINHSYHANGSFDAMLKIETKDGCKDSFIYKAAATVINSTVKIIADKDSTCISNATIRFSLEKNPVAFKTFFWNFGDAASGSKNFDVSNFSTSHTFSKTGPFQVSFTYNNPLCSVPKVFDTVLILGPWSNIEKSNNRMAEYEVYQCMKNEQDSVHFKNLSTFYHNDKTPANDDSTQLRNGNYVHIFNSSQISVNPVNYTESKNRGNTNVQRIWDFGDAYAAKCTTDVKTNAFVNNNCNFSRDSLPVHYYTSWEITMVKMYKNTPMEDAVFDENKRLCKKLLIYPSDSFYIISDTIMIVPRSHADSMLANNSPNLKTKYYLQEKYFYNGKRYISEYTDVQINAGESLTIRTPAGSTLTYNGPITVSLIPGYTVISTDTVRYLFTKKILKDTLPVDFYNLRKISGYKSAIIARYKYNYPGVKGVDYIVNFNRFRDLYYSRIPTAYTARLKQKDLQNPMHCESESVKQLVLMNADAGGAGTGLRTTGQYCLGGAKPGYGVTFLLEDLKPGATFSDVQINYDSFCGKNNFTNLNNLTPGSLPPSVPYGGYKVYGNTPNIFSHQYSVNDLCSKNGCATVGIIVGNGASKSGSKPLCADTQWYENLVCFENPDANFILIASKKPDVYNNLKICKNEAIKLLHPAGNNTKPENLKSIRYEIKTGNAGPNYGLESYRFVQENYYFNTPLKDSAKNKLYDFLVITRGGKDPVQVANTNIWQEGLEKSSQKPDTIITAIVTKWDTIADVSKAWDQLKPKLISNGFDPFSLDGKTLAQMIWNRKGIIGNPATGARGCIDTTGFGHLISFRFKPVNGYKKIIHFRDTSLRPVDTYLENGKYINEYIFKPNHNGYYLASRSMTSATSNCDAMSQKAVIVGFATVVDFPDSIVCQDAGNTLGIKIDYRYFHPDPINFGTWDTYDYWRSGQSNLPITKWDWNKADDDITKPQTIFGGAPYGGSGMGSPWLQLGGGGPNALYYRKDSGIYIFRVIGGDSSGCFDTFTGRVYITKLETRFRMEMQTPACNSIVEFYDSSVLYDPAKRVLKNADGSPVTGDFIKSWHIYWGDGTDNLYSRLNETEPGIPDKIAHKYTSNGWFKIKYLVSTRQGCDDTISQWIRIPGPRPKFSFRNNTGNEITINQNDSVDFINLTDSASKSADWTWFFGDGKLKNTSDSIVNHVYDKAGDFNVFLNEYDSLIIPPNIRKYCNSVYPDTIRGQKLFTVHVLPVNSIVKLQKNRTIYLYPNPSNGIFRIYGSDATSIEILGTDGRSFGVFTGKNNAYDLGALPPGYYIIKGSEKDGTQWRLTGILMW